MTTAFDTSTPTALAFELAAAAHKLVTEVRPVTRGQQVLVSVDSAGDERVARATAEAAHAVGAEVVFLTYPTQREPMLAPPSPLAKAALGADVWFDFAVAYQLYSPAYRPAIENGCIYVTLTGMDVDMMVRTIGRVNYEPLTIMAQRLYELGQDAEYITVTSPAGCDVRMRVDKAGDPFFDNPPLKGFPQMLGGQSWPEIHRESFTGTLVYDGAIWPPAEIGILREPVALEVLHGQVLSFDGGSEAKQYERWLRAYDHPRAMMVDHACYGFNPGVRQVSGRILEDERVFGCTQFGVGVTSQGSPIHTDGVVLNSSVWFDDVQIEDAGRYVLPELVDLCRAMDVPGY
jgi:leucyl aminopeptidase (aminopeptidase T)